MATALKGIQFSSPVLNGTTANNKTTWTYGANDVVVFGCDSVGDEPSERHWGMETHCGYEYHCGYEQHYGDEYHCGYESHNGNEIHYGNETHYGCEEHCGYESHNGFALFSGSCSCATDGFTGTNIRVNGIAVVDPTDSSNRVLLTYSELKSHGF